MSRGGSARPSGKSTEPTDWVTRAADDAIRHAGGQEALTVHLQSADIVAQERRDRGGERAGRGHGGDPRRAR